MIKGNVHQSQMKDQSQIIHAERERLRVHGHRRMDATISILAYSYKKLINRPEEHHQSEHVLLWHISAGCLLRLTVE